MFSTFSLDVTQMNILKENGHLYINNNYIRSLTRRILSGVGYSKDLSCIFYSHF